MTKDQLVQVIRAVQRVLDRSGLNIALEDMLVAWALHVRQTRTQHKTAQLLQFRIDEVTDSFDASSRLSDPPWHEAAQPPPTGPGTPPTASDRDPWACNPPTGQGALGQWPRRAPEPATEPLSWPKILATVHPPPTNTTPVSWQNASDPSHENQATTSPAGKPRMPTISWTDHRSVIRDSDGSQHVQKNLDFGQEPQSP